MKKILILGIVFTVLFSFKTYSQQWLQNMPQHKSVPEYTLNDYKQAFDSYWAPFNVENAYYYENGVKKKAGGWKQFLRWHYYMESQIDPSTGLLPTTSAEEQFNMFFESGQAPKSSNGNWISMGPNLSDGGYAGIGRINCVAFHPSNNNIWWVGAPAGGLWLTQNNGSSWTCLTDQNEVMGVSDIVIPSDYATSQTIYIGTGDRSAWDNRSHGVLKSTDGGSTWNTTGLSFTPASYSMVNRLLLDPNNNNIIIAATTSGIYKTTNSGATWTLLASYNFIDMEYKPGNYSTLYGSTKNGEIYVSTNGGSTWTQAISVSGGYRTELAVSPAQTGYVYAVMANDENGLYGVYRSTNSGASYSQVFSGSSKNLLGWDSSGDDTGGQGWYDLCIAVSPTNANTVLVGGVNTWRSTNGGTSWSIINHWWGDGVQAVHADKHMLSYRSNGDLFECNDGGIYISTNNGTSWTDKTNGIVTSQMYKLGCSATDQNVVITGLQDNGTKVLYYGTWYDVKGGDGMECLIDYTDVNIQYGTYVNGQIDRTTDLWSNTTDISPNGDPDGAWVTPYIIDPANPQILYIGYSNLYKTTNRGNTWTQISNVNSSEKIRSIAIAPSNTQVLYMADNTHIWKTTNGGSSWSNITGSLPVSTAYIRYITVKNNDPSTVWVTMSGYNTPGVYQTTNGGTSWTNISAGLPTIPVNCVVQNKLNTTQTELFCGTDYGVFCKLGSGSWFLFNNGLPNVKIGELEIWYGATSATSKLRAATYGRGLWQSDLYSQEVMTYQSSTTTQTITTDVAPNSVNQQIIGIEIVMNGDITPLSVTSFSFNTNGSTNPTGDISNAKLYYTGSLGYFEAVNQFGSTTNNPNGNFNITGTQALINGTNYFWLCYDIAAEAGLGNYVDAQCTSITIGTPKTPSVTNPDGNRKIAIVYCDAGSPDTNFEYISNISYGTVNNTSLRGTGGYQNFSDLSSAYTAGASLDFSVGVYDPYDSDKVIIWVDWNNNGDFTDAGEKVYESSGTGFTQPHSGSFTIPTMQAVGMYRMRVRLVDAANGPNLTPCGNSSYGEVEDYSIEIFDNTPVTDCPAGSIYSQPILNPSQASASDIPTGYIAATSFEATGYAIESVNIWMLSMTHDGSNWQNCSENPMHVAVQFYENNAGEPGSLMHSFTDITSVMAPAYIDLFGLYTVYFMSIELPTSVIMNNGYVSVQGLEAAGSDCWLMWINAPEGSGLGKQFNGSEWVTSDAPFTLCLTGVEVLPAPEVGTAGSNSPICSGLQAILNLDTYTGNIQWQQSADGTSGWADVSEGTGATTDSYLSGYLTTTSSFRAAVSQSGYETIYSNVVQVVVNPLPAAAGVISGNNMICKGQSIETYTVPEIEHATGYAWTYPTGASGSSTSNSITITFSASALSGNVSVSGQNSCGYGTMSSKAITANNLPTVNLGSDIEQCGGSVTLDAGAGMSSYTWNGTAGTRYYTVNESGNYTVVVTNAAGCSASDNITVTINPVPVVDLGDDLEQCGGSLTLDAGAGFASYTWNGTAGTQFHTVSASGNYEVVVENSFGCTAGDAVDVSIFEIPVVNLGDDIVQCGGSVALDAGSGFTSYTWNGVVGTRYKTISSSGNYTVVVQNSFGCTASDAITVSIYPIPTVSLIMTQESYNGASDGSATAIASGGIPPYQYLWSNDGVGETITALTSGEYCVQVNDANACSVSCCITVTIAGQSNPPTAQFSADQTAACGSLVVQFTDQSTNNPTVWQWNFGDGSPVSNLQHPQHNYTTPGTYSVSLYVENNDGENELVKTNYITVHQDVSISMNMTPASGETNADGAVEVTVNSGSEPFEYTWSNLASTANISGLLPGEYCVNVEDINGCSASDCINVTFDGQDYADFEADITEACGQLTVQFTDLSTGNPITWMWNFGDGSTSSEQNPQHTYISAGSYDVLLVVIYQNGTLTQMYEDYINVFDQPVIEFDIVQESEEGAADGAITMTIIGGTPPYTINWSNNSHDYSITNLSAGVYSVVVIDGNGCILFHNVTLSVATFSILNTSKSIQLYPNPTKESVTIDHGISCVTINITDINGRLLAKIPTEGSTSTIDVSQLNTGMYFVHCIMNNRIIIKKLIIE